jgi:uncharacterized protein YndB with AHSA1/START domain
MSKTQEGYLLIADITGYTMYLSQSELDHAEGTLAALLELLVDHTRPPLVISRLAGDAVISYGLRDNFFQGQTFLEMIENTYVTFRKAIERMALNNTCQCNACANVSSLDLKFFVHFGTFARQRISDHDELVGSDVNLIHRLLKNQVSEITGSRAYTLYTEAAIRQLGLEGLSTAMTPHAEAYEHLGEVNTWIQDMHPIWSKKRDATRISIPPERINLQVEAEIAMSPERVWDYLIQTEFRKTLLGSDRQEITHLAHGRIGQGSVYQCYHGDQLIPQTILEWQPFERIVTQDLVPIPFPNTYALLETNLIPTGAGTRLTQAFSKATGPWLGRAFCDLVLRMSAARRKKDIEAFKAQIEADLAAHDSSLEAAQAFSPETIHAAAAASFQDLPDGP